MFRLDVREHERSDGPRVSHGSALPQVGTRASTKRRAKARSALFALALVGVTAAAGAQPAPTPEEVQQAQVRWNEGKAYFDNGNFEAARVAFKQAYTVFPHAAFLQNLGEAELRTGRPVEAARHFTAFLRAGNSGSPAQRELAKKSLAKASEKLGSIVITTNVDDAEIRVDDELVGRSPLGSMAWFVEPGRHLVTARRDGYLDGSERVEVALGSSKSVFVRVQRVLGAAGEPPSEEPKVASRPAPPPAPPPTKTDVTPPQGAPPQGDPRRGGIPARSIVLLSGAALTIAGAAIGTVYALKTSADTTRIDDAQRQIANRDPRDPKDPGSFCKEYSAMYATLCHDLHSDLEQQRSDRRIRDIAFIGAGMVGVATIATAFLWRPRSSNVSLAPVLTPSAPGFILSGQF